MIFSVHWLLFPSIQKTDISLFLPTRIWFSFILRLVIQVPLIPVDCSCIWSFSTSKSSKKRSYRNSSKPDGIVALRSPFTLRIIEPLGSFAQKVIVIFKNFKKTISRLNVQMKIFDQLTLLIIAKITLSLISRCQWYRVRFWKMNLRLKTDAVEFRRDQMFDWKSNWLLKHTDTSVFILIL